MKLLLVDDDDRFRERMALALADRGIRVMTASGAASALEIQRSQQPTHAVVDLRMPGANGLELLPSLFGQDAEIEVVVLTGYGSIATAVEAIRLGALDYLTKPVDADTVLASFRRESASPELKPVQSLARAEWEHIQRVLQECQGNISHAARRLGLHRRTLQRKLQAPPPGE